MLDGSKLSKPRQVTAARVATGTCTFFGTRTDEHVPRHERTNGPSKDGRNERRPSSPVASVSLWRYAGESMEVRARDKGAEWLRGTGTVDLRRTT